MRNGGAIQKKKKEKAALVQQQMMTFVGYILSHYVLHPHVQS